MTKDQLAKLEAHQTHDEHARRLWHIAWEQAFGGRQIFLDTPTRTR